MQRSSDKIYIIKRKADRTNRAVCCCRDTTRKKRLFTVHCAALDRFRLLRIWPESNLSNHFLYMQYNVERVSIVYRFVTDWLVTKKKLSFVFVQQGTLSISTVYCVGTLIHSRWHDMSVRINRPWQGQYCPPWHERLLLYRTAKQNKQIQNWKLTI